MKEYFQGLGQCFSSQDADSTASIYKTAYSASSGGLDTLLWPLQEHTWYTDINEHKTHIE